MAKDTNFKFGIHAPRQSLDMTPEKILNSLLGIKKPTLVARVTKIWEF